MEGVQYIMNNDEMLARFGISSRLAYGLLFSKYIGNMCSYNQYMGYI